jgi:hypothetical protein
MAVNPFDSPNLLLDRARENREELNARAKRFFDENPCAHFVDRDANTGHYLRKARLSAQFPSVLWAVAADALNNLRSALDQAVCASVSVLNPSASLDGVGFVFGASQTHFENAITRAPKTIDPYVFDVMRFFLTKEETFSCGRSTKLPVPVSTGDLYLSARPLIA